MMVNTQNEKAFQIKTKKKNKEKRKENLRRNS